MKPVLVVDVRCTTEWVRGFDFLEDVREKVKFARDKGTVRSDG